MCKGGRGRERPVITVALQTESGSMPSDPIKEEKYAEGSQPCDEFPKGLGRTFTSILYQ